MWDWLAFSASPWVGIGSVVFQFMNNLLQHPANRAGLGFRPHVLTRATQIRVTQCTNKSDQKISCGGEVGCNERRRVVSVQASIHPLIGMHHGE